MAQQFTTGTLTTNAFNESQQTYYDAKFLERAMLVQRYDMLGVAKNVPVSSGKTVYFNRLTPRTISTTALTEGTTPNPVSTSATTVSATVGQYGEWEQVSDIFVLTGLDKNLAERYEIMGQAAGETLDTLIRDELYTGATSQFAGGKSALTAVAATDTMSVLELRKAVRTLMQNKAVLWEDGLFRGVLTVSSAMNLKGDSQKGNFTDVNVANDKSNAEMVKKGQLGIMANVRLFESNNEKTDASTTTVYNNFITGKEALAMIDVAGSGVSKVFYKTPGQNDTSNPLDLYNTIGWKIPAFVAKTLNSNWIVNIRTGYTAN